MSDYSVGGHGYAQIGWVEKGERQMTLAHRVSWISTFGEIPPELTVDHMCRNRRCFNPWHLRLLTNLENAKDNGFATRTHCPAGHVYDAVNTYRNRRGHRYCRACARQRDRNRARRSR